MRSGTDLSVRSGQTYNLAPLVYLLGHACWVGVITVGCPMVPGGEACPVREGDPFLPGPS